MYVYSVYSVIDSVAAASRKQAQLQGLKMHACSYIYMKMCLSILQVD